MHLCHRDSNHPEGFWLYDRDACGGMNLAMGAPSEIAALVSAVGFWKKRAQETEARHADLEDRVKAFVDSVHTCPTDGGE
jgi:hypothetical protein